MIYRIFSEKYVKLLLVTEEKKNIGTPQSHRGVQSQILWCLINLTVDSCICRIDSIPQSTIVYLAVSIKCGIIPPRELNYMKEDG